MLRGAAGCWGCSSGPAGACASAGSSSGTAAEACPPPGIPAVASGCDRQRRNKSTSATNPSRARGSIQQQPLCTAGRAQRLDQIHVFTDSERTCVSASQPSMRDYLLGQGGGWSANLVCDCGDLLRDWETVDMRQLTGEPCGIKVNT